MLFVSACVSYGAQMLEQDICVARDLRHSRERHAVGQTSSGRPEIVFQLPAFVRVAIPSSLIPCNLAAERLSRLSGVVVIPFPLSSRSRRRVGPAAQQTIGVNRDWCRRHRLNEIAQSRLVATAAKSCPSCNARRSRARLHPGGLAQMIRLLRESAQTLSWNFRHLHRLDGPGSTHSAANSAIWIFLRRGRLVTL